MRLDDDLERKSYRKKKTLSRNTGTKGKARRAKKRKRRILLFAVEGFLLLAVLITAFGYSKWRKINIDPIKEEYQTTNSVAPQVEEVLKGYTNIALFGVDARDNNTLGKGTHADVDMICSINNDTGEIRLVSIYRDTYMSITENNNFNKITQAYFNGGPSQAVGALNKNLDLNIQDYVTVNWKAVADVINILGGIDIEITKSEFAYINGFITEVVESTGVASVHLKAAGMNHLDGVQSVAYARLRLMDTDYQRTERQRLVIQKTMEKAKQANITTLIGIVDIVFPQVLTSLDFNEVLSLAQNIANYSMGPTAGFPFDKQSMMMGKKGDCVIPLGLEQNVYQLHGFLFDSEDYTASDTVGKLDQMLKDATGLHNPGTNSSYVSATQSATASATVGTTEDESKDEIFETDEDGETLNPVRTSSRSGTGEDEGDDEEDEQRGPGLAISPDQSTEDIEATNSPGPGGETIEETSPQTGPGTTAPGATGPGTTAPGATGPGTTGPGTAPTAVTPETSKAAPAGPGSQTTEAVNEGPGTPSPATTEAAGGLNPIITP